MFRFSVAFQTINESKIRPFVVNYLFCSNQNKIYLKSKGICKEYNSQLFVCFALPVLHTISL